MGQELLYLGLVAAISVILSGLVILVLGFKNINTNCKRIKEKSKDKPVLIVNLKSGIVAFLSFMLVVILLNKQELVTPVAAMMKFQISEVNPMILLVGFVISFACTLSERAGDYNRIAFGDIGFLMTTCYFYMSVGVAYIAAYFKY